MEFAVFIGRYIIGTVIAMFGLSMLGVNLSDLPFWKSFIGVMAFFIGAEIMPRLKWWWSDNERHR